MSVWKSDEKSGDETLRLMLDIYLPQGKECEKFRQTLLFRHAHLEYLLFDLVQTPSGQIVDKIALVFGSTM